MTIVNENVSKITSPKNDSNTAATEATKVNKKGINNTNEREILTDKIDDNMVKNNNNIKKDTKKGKNFIITEAEGKNTLSNSKKGNNNIKDTTKEGSKITPSKVSGKNTTNLEKTNHKTTKTSTKKTNKNKKDTTKNAKNNTHSETKQTLGKKEEEKIAKKAEKIVKKVKIIGIQKEIHHNLYMT